jgi:beta-xylosidase
MCVIPSPGGAPAAVAFAIAAVEMEWTPQNYPQHLLNWHQSQQQRRQQQQTYDKTSIIVTKLANKCSLCGIMSI